MRKLLKLQLVRHSYLPYVRGVANLCVLAKFTGYQYGGRPLGITFVKYITPPGHGDAMDGAEPTSGLTQDQIM